MEKNINKGKAIWVWWVGMERTCSCRTLFAATYRLFFPDPEFWLRDTNQPIHVRPTLIQYQPPYGSYLQSLAGNLASYILYPTPIHVLFVFIYLKKILKFFNFYR